MSAMRSQRLMGLISSSVRPSRISTSRMSSIVSLRRSLDVPVTLPGTIITAIQAQL